jgi:hypothetical protein
MDRNARAHRPSRNLRAVAACALLLVLGGCGNQDGPVDFAPEGFPSGVLLVDVQPANADSSQVILNAIAFDPTVADGFRVYNNIQGSGFVRATDYLAPPSAIFSTGWESYVMPVQEFRLDAVNLLVARGAVRGLESNAAPVTEPAYVFPASPLELTRRLNVVLAAPMDSADTDSIPILTWLPVSGATRYLLRIDGRNGITYLALTDQTSHRVRVDPAIRFEDIPMRAGFRFEWQVFALDFGNRVIGRTREPFAFFVVRLP